MFARLLKKRILHHRHPSDCLHYLARCVFFVIIPHRCANNWCTLGVSWPFQAFDFSIFFCAFTNFSSADRESHNAPRILHVFLWFSRAKCGCTYHLCENTESGKKHEKFEHFCGRAKGAANTCKKTYGGT